MIRIFALPFVAILASCAAQPTYWGFSTTECRSLGLGHALGVPDAAELGLTDIRIGRLPDTGKGPGRAAQFIRNRGGAFAEDAAPELIIAVGDWGASCTVRMAQSECPESEEVYQELSKLHIGVGHKFDDPSGILVFHGTQYFLLASDGEGNELSWSYYGAGHSVQKAIDHALDRLDACSVRAERAYRDET